jgi:hypothetical protein
MKENQGSHRTIISKTSTIEVGFTVDVALIAVYIKTFQAVLAMTAALQVSNQNRSRDWRLSEWFAYVTKVSCSSSVSDLELCDFAANFLDGTHALMAKGSAMWDIVHICSAKAGVCDLDEDLFRSQLGGKFERNLLHHTINTAIYMALDGHIASYI